MRKFLLLVGLFLPSKIRVLLLRLMGNDIAPSAKIGLFSLVIANKITMEEGTKIDNFAFIVSLNVLKLKKGSAISRFTYISGGKQLILGKRSLIGSRGIINTSHGDVIFGNYSVLAPRSTIYTHGTFLPLTLGYSNKNKGVSIGDFVWIMQSTSIGPGVKINNNAIVLPGSTIVKAIPQDSVVYDTPTDRKSFPLSLFKKELSNEDLEKLIVSMTEEYLQYLKERGKISFYVSKGEFIEIKIKGKKVNIHFCYPEAKKGLDKTSNYFFWYNVSSNILSSTDYFILDFIKMEASKKAPDKAFKDYNSFMFNQFGLKFI